MQQSVSKDKLSFMKGQRSQLLAFCSTLKILGVLALSLSNPALGKTALTISKVEPPTWWAGHSINPVRLLIRGTGFQGATVEARRGLSASQIAVNSNGTYLFVDVTIPASSQAGDYPLLLRTKAGVAEIPFRIEEPLSSAGRFQGFSPDDVIYLIMPDRFANGDPSNDDPAISKGLYDRTNQRAYHGGDLQGIIDHLPYLKRMGVTALWMTPVYDNSNVRGSGNESRLTTDYHGYGAIDYYAVDEHFGDLSLLRRLVDRAHGLGLKVIQDEVANHVGIHHPWVNNPPTPTWLHGSVAHHLDENFQIWRLTDQQSTAAARAPVLDGWFVLGLPDLNQADPELAQYEIQNTLWWLGSVGFDGIRQDTLPYVPRAFWKSWETAIHRQYPQVKVVGEVFDQDPAVTSFFQGGRVQFDGMDSNVDTVFDFPSYFKIRQCFAPGRSFEDVAKVIADDRLYPHPESLVTFLGNHDTARIASQPQMTTASLKLALALLFTMRGIPSLYYGDELGVTGGNDPDNRRDFPGGWTDDRRDAFTSSGRTADENVMFDYVRKLLSLRGEVAPLRRGLMSTLAVTKQSWVFLRSTSSEAAVVAINKGAQQEKVAISIGGDGVWKSRLGTGQTFSAANGTAALTLAPSSAEIYLRE